MTLEETSQHFGKSEGWLWKHGGVGTSKAIMDRYGEITVETVNKYDNYITELIQFMENIVNEGKVKKSQLGEIIYPNSKHSSISACKFFDRMVYTIRDDYVFPANKSVEKLEKIKEVLSEY